MPDTFLPASSPFNAALSVFFTLCASTIKSMLQALRPVSCGPHQPDFLSACSSRLPPSRDSLQHRTEHLVQIHFPRDGLLACTFQQGANLLELLTADVTGITISHPYSIRHFGETLSRLLKEKEALIVAFREHTQLPLDDCLYAPQATALHLIRNSSS